MSVEVIFLGGAGTVTGSKYLLSANGKYIMVDCGLFQGLKSLRLRNWHNLPVPASEIAAIVLTHAHIDHSGYIPRIIKEGFKGKIYCTEATFDLCKILLPDCGHIHEEEAEYLNRKSAQSIVPHYLYSATKTQLTPYQVLSPLVLIRVSMLPTVFRASFNMPATS